MAGLSAAPIRYRAMRRDAVHSCTGEAARIGRAFVRADELRIRGDGGAGSAIAAPRLTLLL
jgi:hypothetical protein